MDDCEILNSLSEYFKIIEDDEMREIIEPLVRDIPYTSDLERKNMTDYLSQERKSSFTESLRFSLEKLDDFLDKDFIKIEGLRTEVSDIRERIKNILDIVCS